MGADQEILQALLGLAEAFNAHDVERVMSFFSPDCTLDMPRGTEPFGTRFHGAGAVRKGVLGRFESTPDVHYSGLEHFVSGDCGMSRWLLTGTKRDGGKVRVQGCDFYTFRDGLVIRKDSYWKIVE